MEEYNKLRRDLVGFLRSAFGESYDAVYYYIGKYDFDQTNEAAVDVVADLVLTKATYGKTNPYFVKIPEWRMSLLYKDSDGVPPLVEENITRRSIAEQAAKCRGMTYIPDAESFKSLVYGAAAMKSKAEFEEFERELKRSQSFWGEFSNNLEKQLKDPVGEMGLGMVIFYAFALLYTVLRTIAILKR